MLHSFYLKLPVEEGRSKEFQAPLPMKFKLLLSQLKLENEFIK